MLFSLKGGTRLWIPVPLGWVCESSVPQPQRRSRLNWTRDDFQPAI